MKTLLSLGIVGVLFSVGCSTMVIGSKQKIDVYSRPDRAIVKVNYMNAGITPCTLELKRNDDYGISLELPGFKEKYIYLEKRYSGWFWCNLFLGGIVGMCIDSMTGSIYVYNPKEIDIDFNNLGFKHPDGSDNVCIFVGLEPDPNWLKIAEMTPLSDK